MESGAEFVAVDNPHATKLLVHLLAPFAEHKRDQISARTVSALAAAKARGIRLGNPRIMEAAALGRASLTAAAAPARARAEARARAMRSEGATLRTIAAALKAEGLPGLRGGSWGLLRLSCCSVYVPSNLPSLGVETSQLCTELCSFLLISGEADLPAKISNLPMLPVRYDEPVPIHDDPRDL